MMRELQGSLMAGDAKIAVVVGRFNAFFTRHLLDAAVNTWQRLGGSQESLTVVHVPGAFELPVTAGKLAESGHYQAVVCLGCVIRGETDHYDHVVEQAAKGIREVGTRTGVPCIFGLVTADTIEQAINRAGAKMGNQGEKAMLAAVEMANLMEQLEQKLSSNREG